MNIGMLWYDDDKHRPLEEKVQRAVNFYKAKYGVTPTKCYVHPKMLPDGESVAVAGVKLLGQRTIIANHFWLGVDEAVSESKEQTVRENKEQA